MPTPSIYEFSITRFQCSMSDLNSSARGCPKIPVSVSLNQYGADSTRRGHSAGHLVARAPSASGILCMQGFIGTYLEKNWYLEIHNFCIWENTVYLFFSPCVHSNVTFQGKGWGPLYTMAKELWPWSCECPWNSTEGRTMEKSNLNFMWSQAFKCSWKINLRPGSQCYAISIPSYSSGPFYTKHCNKSRVVRAWGVIISQFYFRPTSLMWASGKILADQETLSIAYHVRGLHLSTQTSLVP